MDARITTMGTARQLKLFQGNSTNIVVTEEIIQPTHNAYLGMLNKYGVVFGGCVVAALLYSLILSLRNVICSAKSKDSEVKSLLNPTMLIAAFWMLYFSSIFLNETFYILSYPFMVWMLLFAVFVRKDLFYGKQSGSVI